VCRCERVQVRTLSPTQSRKQQGTKIERFDVLSFPESNEMR
jgi:hypothetical protein